MIIIMLSLSCPSELYENGFHTIELCTGPKAQDLAWDSYTSTSPGHNLTGVFRATSQLISHETISVGTEGRQNSICASQSYIIAQNDT